MQSPLSTSLPSVVTWFILFMHGRRKWGYAGDLTPNYLCGGYWLYIPQKNLIPSHANCMQHVLRCRERQSDGSEYKKPFGGRGSGPDPAEGAYSTPTNSLVGGDGLAVASQGTPSPALGPSGLASPTPIPKLVPTPLRLCCCDIIVWTNTHKLMAIRLL